jgi:hypothetical protein
MPAKASVIPTKLPDTGIACRMSRTTATGIRLKPPTPRLVGSKVIQPADNATVTPSVVEMMASHEAAYLTTDGDMRNLKPPEPSVEATVALSRRRLIERTIASETSMSPQQNCDSFLHLIFDRIGGGRGSVRATGHCFDAIFRSELTEGRAHAGRYSHPRSPNAERSIPGGAYHSPER